MASWSEPVDDLNEPEPKVLESRAHVLELTVTPEMNSISLTPKTGERRIEDSDNQQQVPRPITSAAVIGLPTPVYRQEFGDTRFRRVNYSLIATTRYQEQFPASELPREAIYTRSSQPVEVKVLNSAPPAMPKIAYVIPSFKWERKRDRNQIQSTRKSALRVYIERPWYSSGEGELLAVILPPGLGVTPKKRSKTVVAGGVKDQTVTAGGTQPPVQARPQVQKKITQPPVSLHFPAVPTEYRPYVTMWGADPIWKSGSTWPPEYPSPEAFPAAVEIMGELPLLEMPEEKKFIAVGHEVEYDKERGLWYCDLELDPGQAYFPFIRLALARFQPDSVPGAHLSKVVVTNFGQILPERVLGVTFNPSNLAEIGFTLSGISYNRGYGADGPGVVEVSLETRKLNLPEEIGWEEVPETSITLKPQSSGARESSSYVWKGSLKLPREIKVRDYRLTIREYEIFDTDELDRTKATVTAVPKKFKRLVYAETIKLADL